MMAPDPRRRRHRRLLAVLAVVAFAAFLGVASLGVAPVAGAAPRGPVAQGGEGSSCDARRLLVLSLPTLAWADLGLTDLPNLEALLAESAVGGMSVRGVARWTSTGDAYATVSAGTRARGTGESGLAFQRGEVYEGVDAAEVFALRTGTQPTGEDIFFVGLPSVIARNERLPYDAEIGLLGDTLAAAGHGRAVIANADHQESLLQRDQQRGAAVALMGADGIVPAGAVSERILVDDPEVPFGERLDEESVLDALDEVWLPGSVVLVEGSDLLRFDQFRDQATVEQAERLQVQTLQSTDALVGRLLERVDPTCDAVLVLAASHSSKDTHVTVAAVRAPEVEPGWLRSPSTRRLGVVNIVDVAPTVLDLMGIGLPSGMEGRAYEYVPSGTAYASRADLLVDDSHDAKFRDSLVGVVSLWYVLLQILLSGLAGVALSGRGHRRLRRVLLVSALGLQGYLVASFVATLLPFSDWGSAAYWAFLFTGGAVVAAVALLVGRRDPVVDPLMAALGILWVTIAIEVLVGTPMQWNGVFGYSPTVAGRFAGLGNLGYAMFCGAAILLAALIAHRVPGRRGVWLGVALLGVTFVLDGAPMWGADVGGVLSFVPAACVTATLLLGWRVRWRAMGVFAVATVVLFLAFGFLDLSRPSGDRTHLGRLFESVGDEGWSAFETVVVRKLGANLSVLTSSVWTLMLPAVFAFLGYLVWRAPGKLRLIGERIPEIRAAVAGLITLGVLGFALNDSGIAVPGMLIGVVNASLVYLLIRIDDEATASGGPPPDPDRGRRDDPDPDRPGPAGGGGEVVGATA